jgi:hypothetical protein
MQKEDLACTIVKLHAVCLVLTAALVYLVKNAAAVRLALQAPSCCVLRRTCSLLSSKGP